MTDATTPPTSAITSVAVIGFGTMGSGIAHVCAQAGIDVRVIEQSEAVIERDMAGITRQLDRAVEKGRLDAAGRDATLARLTTSTELATAFDAQLVIEAIPERLALKQELFATLDEAVGPETILATNTSALSVTEIAAST
ncbi:MAG: 3-hydroxyacyl-CoA dehydrogenase family protein, partial [Thermoleophilia bacterium]|nr:3-hydroxyacyl-CoA dehydrogenase family protein [Thermoleophilia bacterium]